MTFCPLSSMLPRFGTTWAIHAGYAARAIAALEAIPLHLHQSQNLARIEIGKLTGDDKQPPYTVEDGVATLSLCGPMTKQGSSWGDGTSTVALRRALSLADRDPAVTAIVLLVDSPGGTVAGTADLASVVASLKNPCMAYLEDMACSAAYWVASQADAVYANETALVGSIGIVMALTDFSRAFENIGLKQHVIRSGKHKGAGIRGAPITDEQTAGFQAEIDALGKLFAAVVQKSRRLSDDQVSKVTDGRCHVGQAAVDMGLVDRIMPLREATSLLRSHGHRMPRSAPKKAAMKDRLSGFLHGVKSSGTPLDAADLAVLRKLDALFGTTPTNLTSTSERTPTTMPTIAELQQQLDRLKADQQQPKAPADKPKMTAARRRELLSATPEGRAILAEEAARAH